MVSHEDDMLVVSIKVHYPEWLNELSNEEFANVMAKAEDMAIVALAGKIHEAEQYWRTRRALAAMGQMTIEDLDG